MNTKHTDWQGSTCNEVMNVLHLIKCDSLKNGSNGHFIRHTTPLCIAIRTREIKNPFPSFFLFTLNLPSGASARSLSSFPPVLLPFIPRRIVIAQYCVPHFKVMRQEGFFWNKECYPHTSFPTHKMRRCTKIRAWRVGRPSYPSPDRPMASTAWQTLSHLLHHPFIRSPMLAPDSPPVAIENAVLSQDIPSMFRLDGPNTFHAIQDCNSSASRCSLVLRLRSA